MGGELERAAGAGPAWGDAPLPEREEQMRQITTNIREVVWLTDWDENRLLYVSPSYEQVWGRTCESLYRDPGSWAEALHPEDRERVYTAFIERADGGGYQEEYRIVRPDGSQRWIFDRAFPIRDARGRTYRLAGISEDVTERKHVQQALLRSREELERRVAERTRVLEDTARRLEAEVGQRQRVEERLRESEERFRQLAENIDEVFWLTAADFSRVLYVSPAYERVWGRPAQALLDDAGQWIDAVVEEDRVRVHETFFGAALEDRYDAEYRIRRPDGSERWIHDRGFVVRGPDGRAERIAGLALDVTRRKEIEDVLAAQQERLRALAQELVLAEERERRRLAVDLHDGLNQTTTLAILRLDALRGRVPAELAAEVDEVREIVAQADRAARSLTFQLSPPVLFDFGLEAGVQWLADEVQRTHGLAVNVQADAEPVALDERLQVSMYRAARELLINAAKHARASRADVCIAVAAGELVMEIEDDGRSFEAEVDDLGGFGLFSIRERMSALGGRMELHARPGEGTTVRLSVPLHREEA